MSDEELFGLRLDDVKLDERRVLYQERMRRSRTPGLSQTNITAGDQTLSGKGSVGVQQAFHRTRL
jgi:hypothetical protein